MPIIVWRRNPTHSFRSIVVVQDRAHAAGSREQRVAAAVEQLQVERLVRLPLLVALYLNRDRFRGLAGSEGDCAGRGRVVTARRRGAVDGAVDTEKSPAARGRPRARRRNNFGSRSLHVPTAVHQSLH